MLQNSASTMANDITSHRAAIGAFHCKCYCRFIRKYTFLCRSTFAHTLNQFTDRFRTFFIGVYWCFLFSATKTIVQNNDFQFLLMILLLISMDVESNPGPESEISIFNWNTRSVRNKLDYLQDIACEYNILCLTETHLDVNIPTSELMIENFAEPFRRDRNFMGGGLLVYCSETIYSKRRLDIEPPNCEILWTEIKLNNMVIMFCALYRPPNSNDTFWDHLNYSIEKAYEISQHIVIAGDINVNMLSSLNRHPLADIMSKYNLQNTITEPTRVGQVCQTLLDPVLITDSISFSHSYVIDVDRVFSDHNAAVSYLNVPVQLNNAFQREIWIYKKGDFEKLNKLVTECDWELLFANSASVDDACELFSTLFLSMAKQCIPIKLVTIRPNDKPWITSDLRREIKIRDRIHKKYKLCNSITNLNNFKRQRNKVNNMKKYARLSFYENADTLIDQLYTGDPKSYWRLIKRLTKQVGTSSVIPPLIDSSNNNMIVSDDKDKASLLNSYFCSISTLNDNGIDVPYFERRTNASFDTCVISENEVSDVLGILKLGKASGPDTISHQMLKYTKGTVCRPLTLLFNSSLRAQKFPNLWKKATVLPLFKKGDRHNVSNYRPVSLISCVGKVFERVVFKHMYNFALDKELFYKFQSGF